MQFIFICRLLNIYLYLYLKRVLNPESYDLHPVRTRLSLFNSEIIYWTDTGVTISHHPIHKWSPDQNGTSSTCVTDGLSTGTYNTRHTPLSLLSPSPTSVRLVSPLTLLPGRALPVPLPSLTKLHSPPPPSSRPYWVPQSTSSPYLHQTLLLLKSNRYNPNGRPRFTVIRQPLLRVSIS